MPIIFIKFKRQRNDARRIPQDTPAVKQKEQELSVSSARVPAPFINKT